tara:strand:+ start:140 stop:328 length:189 start_codon:yes stop_codon:yes gene_type:complete
MKNFLYLLFISLFLTGCGKVGPLSLPEEKLDKSVISYPCDKVCMEKFEAEKKRQQSVIIEAE